MSETATIAQAEIREEVGRRYAGKIGGAAQKQMAKSKYKADIAGGSLKLQESRIIADLLLKDMSAEDWRQAIEEDNVLQKRSPGTAARQASLLRARLMTMSPELWELVRDGSKETATHALLAAAVKHSAILAEFLDRVVRERFRTFKHDLPRKLWDEFVLHLRDEDPEMPVWNDSTTRKLGDSVFQILKEAGFIADTKNYLLQPVQIAPAVLTYLRETGQKDVVQCLQVTL
ncbi:hypothetical protein U879_06050 [Defluviimonas sp. 20V17]|uniref:DUF1819 family protein n=1 Tax=Allgaiera indica TaxID=765699 RepID=A0AAN4UPK3_9RHOB|nr:DUF1819 family protein [Allgaiera indica]KDB04513.1 hypothetical protein U879_06050 [Defluviimonas sp. 20V17]GHD99778.1 hypothetical protein GCM10008024_08580 [Allgaiera indica]